MFLISFGDDKLRGKWDKCGYSCYTGRVMFIFLVIIFLAINIACGAIMVIAVKSVVGASEFDMDAQHYLGGPRIASFWVAVKHFRDLRRLNQSTESTIGDCFRVLIKSHVLYFSKRLLSSTSMVAEILDGALQILSGVQMFVLGPRLILSVREYHAKLVANSNAETKMSKWARSRDASLFDLIRLIQRHKLQFAVTPAVSYQVHPSSPAIPGQATVELTPFKHIIGVDPSSKMIKVAQETLEKIPLSTGQYEYVQTSTESLPFLEDSSVDLVIAGIDPLNSVGPYWQQLGRFILENHLVEVPEGNEIISGVFREYSPQNPTDGENPRGDVAVRFWKDLKESVEQEDGRAVEGRDEMLEGGRDSFSGGLQII
ncbi:hypothetical protein BDR04DRAFT_1117177 [Suillus decipiens]|nr:hypothetical protein BDR04DRAFT_1117177 [Suillus decipiens]